MPMPETSVVEPSLPSAQQLGWLLVQTNRLKLIKRQSYRRAGLDLLQRRMVLTA